MSTADTPELAPEKRVMIDAPWLWAGGLETAVVAALSASVGVVVCRDLLNVELVEPPLLRFTNSFPLNYAITAFVLALAATGLANRLSVITPKPRAFFGCIVGLVTAATMVLPFALEGSLKGKVCASMINLMIGLSIASLLSGVLATSVLATTYFRPVVRTPVQRRWRSPRRSFVGPHPVTRSPRQEWSPR